MAQHGCGTQRRASRCTELRGHKGAVLATKFDGAGRRLATLGTDRAVRVWDVRSGRELKELAGVHNRTNVQNAWSEGVDFVGDDRVAVSPWARGTELTPVVARIFDPSTGDKVGVVEHPSGETGAREIAVSPDGTLLAATHVDNDPDVYLYRLPGGELLDVVEAHTSGPIDIEFSRDGSLLATGGVDGAARVWNTQNGKLREVLAVRGHSNPVMSVSFSGDATRLVTVGETSQEARVWDVSPAGRGEVLTLPGPREMPEVSMGASHSRPTAAGSSHPPARRARSASGTRRQGTSSSFSTGTRVGTHGRARSSAST